MLVNLCRRRRRRLSAAQRAFPTRFPGGTWLESLASTLHTCIHIIATHQAFVDRGPNKGAAIEPACCLRLEIRRLGTRQHCRGTTGTHAPCPSQTITAAHRQDVAPVYFRHQPVNPSQSQLLRNTELRSACWAPAQPGETPDDDGSCQVLLALATLACPTQSLRAPCAAAASRLGTSRP